MYQVNTKQLTNTTSSQQIEKRKENILQVSIVQKYIESMDEKTKMKFWIKTLLSSYNIFPEIIRTIDKIIELQATSLSFYTDIFNMSKSSIKDYEKVIDLTDRKDNLINIFIMTKTLIKGLKDDDKDLIEKKFIDGYNIDELAEEYQVSKRTIFRRIDKILGVIYSKAKERNWTIRSIEMQVKNESWLAEKFFKLVCENYKNSNYKSTQNVFNEIYNKSSSELYVGNLG